MTCLHCGAETTNGLALCELCRGAASAYLEWLPVYFRNLARWRPGRAGGRRVPSSREPQGAFPVSGDRVSRALDEAGSDIATWARCLRDDRGVVLPAQDEEAVTVSALCRLLNENMTSIATLEWAGEFVVAMGKHETNLRNLTERVAPGWYAGACKRCGVGTYVVPGLTWVTCGACGVTTYARDHLDTIIDEARAWVARPKALAEALVALLDSEASVPRLYDRIRKWESLGWLVGVRKFDADGDPVGPKRYRLGDVLDLLGRKVDTDARAESA